jgi:hypothetical protein
VDGGIGTGTARLVVGADGEHFLVARAVSAASYHQKPALSFACYPYWPGLPVTSGVMDSITAPGITNALRDAELLAGAIVAGLDDARPLSASLAEH